MIVSVEQPTQAIAEAFRAIQTRHDRGAADMLEEYGKQEALPLISVARARRLGRILWLIGGLTEARLDLVDQVARLCCEEQYGKIIGDSSHAETECKELAAVVRALSFDPDSWVQFKEPTTADFKKPSTAARVR
ncbi:MAG: hypothetical protein M3082_18770 [Candidatus Dormibacteraeota bacterium]|nr:hypothetical protein [Candidatus Dormibacteraeota bacterium]